MCNVSYEVGNYAEYLPHVNFDVVISALSIHQLEDNEKRRLFQNIYDRLPAGGIFVNYDQFCSSDTQINDWFSSYWERGLHKSGLTNEDIELWKERQKLARECSVRDEIGMLAKSGFISVECVFTYQKFAVIVAIKQAPRCLGA